MNLGIFLPIGGSLDDLDKNGKLSRLVDYYVPAYRRKFDNILIFSYSKETQRNLPSGCSVVPNRFGIHRYVYTFLLIFLNWRKVSTLDYARVMQIEGMIPAIIFKVFFRKKFAVTYGYDYKSVARIQHKYGRLLLYILLENLLSIADLVIFSSKSIRDTIGVSLKNFAYFPNGIDINLFKPMARKKHKYFEILTQNRLVVEKNIDMLIRSISKIKSNQKIRLTVIGRGPLLSSLKDLARNLNVNVQFISEIDNKEMPVFYADCDLFVMPSSTEGAPKRLIEAAACGCCCLVADISQNREILGADGGVYFNLTEDDLREKIVCLMENDKNRHFIGRKASLYARKNFDITNILSMEIEKIFQKRILVICEKSLSDSFFSGIQIRIKQMGNYFKELGMDVNYFSQDDSFFPWKLFFIVNSYDFVYMTQSSSKKSAAYFLSRFSFRAKIIIDLYTPLILEKKTYTQSTKMPLVVDRIRSIVTKGDFYVCATPRQKKYYIDLLASWGILEPKYKISVVPFIPEIPEVNKYIEGNRQVFKVLWLGAFYPWFSSNDLIDSINLLRNENIELVIVGGKNPKTKSFDSEFEDILNKASQLGLLGTKIKLVPWLKYKELFTFIKYFDVGVCISKISEEDNLAIRSRMLTMLQSDLPLIINGNDEISQIIKRLKLGIYINKIDAKLLAEAILKIKNMAKINNVWKNILHELIIMKDDVGLKRFLINEVI